MLYNSKIHAFYHNLFKIISNKMYAIIALWIAAIIRENTETKLHCTNPSVKWSEDFQSRGWYIIPMLWQGDRKTPVFWCIVSTNSLCTTSLSYCHTTVVSETTMQPLIHSSASLHGAPGIKHPLVTSAIRHQPGLCCPKLHFILLKPTVSYMSLLPDYIIHHNNNSYDSFYV